MQWSEVSKDYIEALKPVNKTDALKQRIISLIDLTSLNETDTPDTIAALCRKARSPYGHVAAVCVYPHFVRLVATEFAGSPIKTVTVANFPEGDQPIENVLLEIEQATLAGAREIDVVFPYHRYLAGERQYAHTFIARCKAACGEAVALKAILETGALMDLAIIADASYEALTAGADFVKTSTGKIAEGATMEAAATMLLAIRHASSQLKRELGIKISGGIRQLDEAALYVELADRIMGPDWVCAETFRLGSSQLIDEIVRE